MGTKDDKNISSYEGLFSYLIQPLKKVGRYFFPSFECTINISQNHKHIFSIKNVDTRKLEIVSVNPLKGFFRKKYSVKVESKLLHNQTKRIELFYPYEEMEWCIICIKRMGLCIPQIKEVRELPKFIIV